MAKELIELGRRKKKCGPGEVRRKGYTIKKGKAKGTYVEPGCVVDQGEPGKTPKSKQVLPEPTKGALSCMMPANGKKKRKDWAKDDPAKKRRAILKCVVTKKLPRKGDTEPCRTGINDLNLLANYTKRTSPDTHRKARADMAWLRKQSWCKLKTKNGNGK